MPRRSAFAKATERWIADNRPSLRRVTFAEVRADAAHYDPRLVLEVNREAAKKLAPADAASNKFTDPVKRFEAAQDCPFARSLGGFWRLSASRRSGHSRAGSG